MLAAMRVPGVPLSIALLLACGTAAAAPAPAKAPPPAPPASMPDPVRTSDQLKRESVEGAAMTPLRDLNVVRSKVPPVLLAALADPYARPPRGWKCPQLIALIQPLDAALGDDLDLLPAEDEDLMDRSRGIALGTSVDIAMSAIPFHGWIRKLSGAERHDRFVQSAILAGDVRRAYLKGLGEAKGCNPPGTPSHERAGMAIKAVAAEEKPRFKPLYPTRMPPAAQQTAAGSPQSAPPR